MPTPTYKPLATITLGSTSSLITLSNIPAAYRDLVLTWNGSNSVGANLFVRFNGNSSSAYAHVVFGATGSIFNGAASATGVNQAGSGTASGNSMWQIFDYAQTDRHKTVLMRTADGVAYVAYSVDRFVLNDAITSISISPASGSFQVGCKINLYGIVA